MAVPVKKLYPSSSAFMWENLVITQYSSGCLRSILLQAEGLWTDIDPKYKILGELNERRIETDVLQPDDRIAYYSREHPMRLDTGVPGVLVSGRADFLLYYKKYEKPIVLELKSADSANTKRYVIEQGKPKLGNVAQTIGYMVDVEHDKGILRYDHYKLNDEAEYEPTVFREFKITLDEQGNIYIDKQLYDHTVGDYLNHRLQAAITIKNRQVRDRPDNWNAKFGSPCHFCNYKIACNKYDKGEISSTDNFVNEARQLIQQEATNDEC